MKWFHGSQRENRISDQRFQRPAKSALQGCGNQLEGNHPSWMKLVTYRSVLSPSQWSPGPLIQKVTHLSLRTRNFRAIPDIILTMRRFLLRSFLQLGFVVLQPSAGHQLFSHGSWSLIRRKIHARYNQVPDMEYFLSSARISKEATANF